MLSQRIEGATRVVGKSQGYFGLAIRDVVVHCTVNGPDTPAMETAWEPTPAELALILEGKPIIVRILGKKPPPMMLYVE